MRRRVSESAITIYEVDKSGSRAAEQASAAHVCEREREREKLKSRQMRLAVCKREREREMERREGGNL